MATFGDAFAQTIETAVESALKRVMRISDISPRRLIKAAEAARYLALSEREIYNMIANNELTAIRQGRAIMLDLRELDEWIERKRARH